MEKSKNKLSLKKKKWRREYQRKRYHSDPEYRKRMIKANALIVRRKELNDPEFRKKRLEWNRKAQTRHRNKKNMQVRSLKTVS